MTPLASRRILLVIAGGIAAYKALDLIRRLKERGALVTVIMTKGATEFVTPLAAGALSGGKVYTELFDRDDEQDVGHIRLARDADLVLVAPATADLMAKMTGGHADDLASAVLLAGKGPILLAPAMNPAMWANPATKRNVAQLAADGVHFVGPATGEMAEAGEAGTGRMSEPLAIVAAAEALFSPQSGALSGRHVVVTAGPTQEPIDPVRYIANRSSGRQGYAIAAAAAAAGARVTLISGPVNLAPPPGVTVHPVETARDMLAAVEIALPADIAIFAAAVADWRPKHEVVSKIKKDGSGKAPPLVMTENPDILATVAHRSAGRPRLVVGFAAETDELLANAKAKLDRKGCDVIVANDVSPGTGVMGGADNTVCLVTAEGVERWPELPKEEVGRRLIDWIAARLARD
ncbi:bifunctional phosphopantothenoylcysteine decarboxylase/phosphopantothenate--cysteine ligase CoaBC [Kaistia algarum]|uniref:bifunctional phosphopantothenoylcysteine decarboxylase/phosphopantothenate--cysteine ligase CoaBC n=1 Tax=Kaistia algarum TaxID=2083279 RepID=UPI000CE76CD1|nr:bifunctional phosphopantothenoylcysteine decarboxylase/phosphopantothenate--cysteine ligase CoaBC [Kaistia algarum]MCX5513581.1 bifunctional phosphopantothenoylcysteine decarboxylase/phosphopantothenate--cysteine ligase CoaBC [Kaistia algarum]PPE77646.1 bifunctional phosphopantothenoylcysteine decarboxylase/phosphopantothenate--cysteine ligase CoaBC [Kaistia algarum]